MRTAEPRGGSPPRRASRRRQRPQRAARPVEVILRTERRKRTNKQNRWVWGYVYDAILAATVVVSIAAARLVRTRA